MRKLVNVKRQSVAYGSYNTRTLTGGVNVRSSPLLVSGSEKGAVQSPEMYDSDLFQQGAITCRNSKQLQVDTTFARSYFQTPANTTSTLAGAALKISAVCIPFTATASTTIREVAFLVGMVSGSYSCQAILKADNAGSPGADIALSEARTIPVYSVTGLWQYFDFGSDAVLTAATNYWLCVTFFGVPTGAFKFGYNSGGGTIKTTSDSFATFSTISGVMAGAIYLNGYSINGIYDYRSTDSSGNYTQNIVASTGAALMLVSGSSATGIATGFGQASTNLADFCTVDNLLIAADYSNSNVRAWDGSVVAGSPASYPVMSLGYRATFNAAEAASGSIAAGVYKIMAVTQLRSGGYRASAEATVTVTGGSKKIAVTSVNMNSSSTGAQFGFDIDATATIWFMTLVGGAVYYRIPNASMSVTNPAANNTNSFDITAAPAGTENTTLAQYGIPQGYFTGQVTTPQGKFVRSWNGFLVMAGDPLNQSRLWVSELGAPQIWSGYGGIQGNYLEIGTDDGQIIRGLAVYNQFLYVFKNHSVYRVEYTGNAAAPFIVSKTQGNVGTLSHWSIKEIPAGLVFMSEAGPAICYGNVSKLIGDTISPWFDQSNISVKFKTTSFPYIVSGINNLKKQVWWVFESADLNTEYEPNYKTLTLVWDWENNAWWLNRFGPTNYIATVGNAQGMDEIWSGDYSGRLFKHEYTNIYVDGFYWYYRGVDWSWSSPHLRLDDLGGWKLLDNMFLFMRKTSEAQTITVDVFLDMSPTASYTYTISTDAATIETGYPVPIRGRAKTVRFVVSGTTSTSTSKPPQLQGFRIEAANVGSQT